MKKIGDMRNSKLSGTKSAFNLLISIGFASISTLCGANNGSAGVTPRTGEDTIETQLQRFIEQETSRIPGRIEVDVGQLDPRLNLAPCARTEAYLPSNTRLWGKSQIGLRCVSGAFWNVTVPIQVRVFGPALVTSRSIQAGQPLLREDFRQEELELTKESGRPVLDIATLENKTLSRSVAGGVIVREDWLRAIPVIQSGDQVRVLATGTGFSITSEGSALNSATEGQQVRVRAESGRVVTGIARQGRIAEIRL